MNEERTFEFFAHFMISECRKAEQGIEARMAQEFFQGVLGLHLNLEESYAAWRSIVQRWEEAKSQKSSSGTFRQAVATYFLQSEHLKDPIITEFNEFQRLRHSSTTDYLTGANNRRSFDAMLMQEVHRARRYGEDVSLVLFDLNRFKEVNDTHGHEFGDRLLALTGKILKGQLRISDTAYRVGGDEFALLLPQTSQAGALTIAERFRKHFAEEVGTITGLQVPISLAFGVANCPREATEAKAIFALADQRLYEFKRSIGSPRCAPRRYKRIPTEDLDAHVLLRAENTVCEARLVDFSFGGLGLRLDEAVHLPDSLVGDLHLPVLPAASIPLRKVYARSEDGGQRIGCAFLEPPSSPQDHEAQLG